MALSLSSPGISIKEVDLTTGSVSATSSLSAGIAGPFARGPVDEVVEIRTEKDLLNTFGPPSKENYHYEYWYSASNFLSYGGSLKVVRADSDTLKNSNAGVGTTSVDLKIKNFENYQSQITPTYFWGAKTPGSWSEEIKVCVIDNFADQIISGVGTTAVSAGIGVTQALSNGHILKGIVSGVGSSEFYVKITNKIVSGTETTQDYTERGIYSFTNTSQIFFNGSLGIGTGVAQISDWYNSQYILNTANGDNQNVLWKSIAPKPKTNQYVIERGGSNDAINIAVIDSTKKDNISGTPQQILEVFRNLSKATDTLTSPSQNVYYKSYLAENSRYIYAGAVLAQDNYWGITPVASAFSSGFTPVQTSSNTLGQEADGINFNSIGNKSFILKGGKDYSTGTNKPTNVGGFNISVGDVINSIDKLANPNEVSLNFLLQGSASGSIENEQTKANHLISVAENRKDCIAFISAYRGATVDVSSESAKLNNILSFFTPLTSSSYAVFDSGYQYVYDRFNKEFVYMPCSADVAGLCVRTDINQHPWFSPAGRVRGTLKNVIKLSYNPNQDDRDELYSNRINPIINYPGSGTILYGDKTALSYPSAFDRINVRRLFITIEQAIRGAADAQLFEFNDSATRANFINIVEPYLRDVQAKRGITDFLLVCDETNNTPDVIDRNEFIADIFVKPARSINFIGLTFVATRTGVSFETVVGTI